ncbi:MAG TPA: hypothetical protein VHZ55_03130, partial [Bryobacteraceae bacterium]|nr:hypothetical protein [Bryobacteraceae bacterium]
MLTAQNVLAVARSKSKPTPHPYGYHSDSHLKTEDLKFLEDYEKRCFRYFWEQWNERTGLVLDRARIDGAPSIHIGSIAATGFGLTAFCIGAEHGWVPRDQARNRVLTSLRFLQRR